MCLRSERCPKSYASSPSEVQAPTLPGVGAFSCLPRRFANSCQHAELFLELLPAIVDTCWWFRYYVVVIE